eukprot:1502521-Rhodomonas_salina.1
MANRSIIAITLSSAGCLIRCPVEHVGFHSLLGTSRTSSISATRSPAISAPRSPPAFLMCIDLEFKDTMTV